MPLSTKNDSPASRAPRKAPVYLSPVRRIQRVATTERICAMAFFGGPSRLPANPDRFRGKGLTLVLAELLERYGARGTFAVVGDTSANYPDRAGKHGSPSWSGAAYDHVPDFGKDGQGGVANCPELVSRLLAGGHELASLGYGCIPFGPLPLSAGRRKCLRGPEQVMADLKRLHQALDQGWNYPLRLGCPPRGMDGVRGGFSSYDAYAVLGYQYLSASFDGAARVPLSTYQAEVAAMWRPMERLLLEDPDALRGQIIGLPNGYNTARRTPVADGLTRQLQLLTDLGYRVVTVSELLERSPFRDAVPDSAVGRAARRLLGLGWCVAYQDNTLRPDAVLTRGELAMMAFGSETVRRRIELIRCGRAPFRDMAPRHPYAAAAALAEGTGAMAAANGRFRPDDPVTGPELDRLCAARLGRRVAGALDRPITHGEFFLLASQALERGQTGPTAGGREHIEEENT